MERSYHIFYQLLQDAGDQICPETLRGKCRLTSDIYDYVYVSQGKTKVQHFTGKTFLIRIREDVMDMLWYLL